jgi:hypothetical protein
MYLFYLLYNKYILEKKIFELSVSISTNYDLLVWYKNHYIVHFLNLLLYFTFMVSKNLDKFLDLL